MKVNTNLIGKFFFTKTIKNHLHCLGGGHRYTLTERRGSNRFATDGWKKWYLNGERQTWIGAHRCIFVARSLKLLYSEEICGRLGRVSTQVLAYHALRTKVRWWSVSFTVCSGFVIFDNQAQQTETDPAPRRIWCAGFIASRLSKRLLFNLRVWSWLRTNAGGRPNTCKSSAPSGERRTG